MSRPPRVALATAAEVPDLDDDAQVLRDALVERGALVDAAIWDATDVDWASYDLVVVRCTWDYAERRAEFVTWAQAVAGATRLANPAPMLRWSTDKRYLRDLEAAGVSVVASHFLDPEDGAEHPWLDAEHVVKPAVSAGSRDTTRLAAGEAERSRACVRAIHASGRTVLVQPYLAAVDEHGETAVVHVDGAYSHTLRKGPILVGGAAPVHGLFAPEQMSVREPSAAERELAERAVALVPELTGEASRPLYARVDLLRDDHGDPVLLELELAEPSLFLDLVPTAAGPLADAILARARGPRDGRGHRGA